MVNRGLALCCYTTEKGVIMHYDTIDASIVNTIISLQKKYGKKYCFPTQEKLLFLLKEYHDVKICRRTLNRRLKKLEQGKLIKRIRRHRRGAGGMIIFKATAYYLSAKYHQIVGFFKRLWLKVSVLNRVTSLSQYHDKSKESYLTERLNC